MIEWLIVPIVFFALCIQAIAGFGSGLIAMPLLIALLGLKTAAPLYALVVQTTGIIMFIRYRHAWNWRGIWRISLASLLAIPLGVWVAQQIQQEIIMPLLGLAMLAYASYSLLGMQVPRLENKRWGYGLGFLAGLLHGAYNTGGPPLIIYGTSQRWHPAEFKSNLQSLFFVIGLVVIGTHYVAGHITPIVLQYYLLLIPVILIAMPLGFSLDSYVKPQQFRRGVLVLLLVLGLSMVL